MSKSNKTYQTVQMFRQFRHLSPDNPDISDSQMAREFRESRKSRESRHLRWLDGQTVHVKTGSSRSGTDERGKCDNVGLSAACPSNEATIRSVVVVVA